MSQTVKEQEVKEQVIALAKIRAWATDQIIAETDKEVRDYLFETRQAIGFALLHLQRVEYLAISISENQVESPPSPSEAGALANY